MSRPVTVQDVLVARDARAQRQAEWLRQYQQPLISFTMNIAGSIKADEEIIRAFGEGERWIRAHLEQQHVPVLAFERRMPFTGCEALWAVQADAVRLKTQLTAMEESCPLGRLFDMDVIDAEGRHLSRGEERPCLICGSAGRACARSRAHSSEALFARAKEIIRGHFAQQFAAKIAQCAQQALLYEALTTPKPGLVDCLNSGAHQDMDIFSFAASASALGGYFEDCVHMGQQGQSVEQLQHAGILAEEAMLEAAGANTHKGAIFSLGILCYAMGRCGEGACLDAVLAEAGRIGRHFLAQMTTAASPHTGGEQQYLQYGLTGARGEAASGFRTVRETALPVLEDALKHGASANDAGKAVLIRLMGTVMDSNVIRRGGMAAQEWMMAQAAQLARDYTDEALLTLDKEMIRRNISPGGSADLLAAVWFLHLAADRGGIYHG